MARPSLKAEKTEHILQAYERCVALYGVEGATLQKVAEEADMARPLLRHYVGNQEDLLAQSIERYFERQALSMAGLQDIRSVDALLDALFDRKYFEHNSQSKKSENDIMIASAFTLAAQQHRVIKQHMQSWFSQYQSEIQACLTRLFPQVDKERIKSVSTGLIGIYFNLYAMQPVTNDSTFLIQSRTAASIMLDSLS